MVALLNTILGLNSCKKTQVHVYTTLHFSQREFGNEVGRGCTVEFTEGWYKKCLMHDGPEAIVGAIERV